MEMPAIVRPRKEVPWMAGMIMELHVAYVNQPKPLFGIEVYHTLAYGAACRGDINVDFYL
jgi:hypothetical protein